MTDLERAIILLEGAQREYHLQLLEALRAAGWTEPEAPPSPVPVPEPEPSPPPVPMPEPEPMPAPLPEPAPGDWQALCLAQGHGWSVSRFWAGWCVRDNQGPGPNGLRFWDGPGDPPAYGVMYRNTAGGRPLMPGIAAEGWLDFQVYFNTDTEPNNYGGKHLIALSSDPLGVLGPRPADGKMRRWMRVDMMPRDGRLRFSLDSYDAAGNRGPEPTWTTGQPLDATRKWVRVRLEWKRVAPDLLMLRVNDAEQRMLNIHPESDNPGRFLFVGNMDRSRLLQPDGTYSVPVANNMDGPGEIWYAGLREAAA